MSAVLDSTTPAANDAPVTLPAVVTLREAALARYTPTEIQLQALALKYRDVVYDVSTSKGLGEAKAARYELRESGRFVVQRVRDAAKDELNALKGTVDEEAARLIAITRPIEDAIDALIEARENHLKAEKAERERIEALRVETHKANLAIIRSYTPQAHGKSHAEIEGALTTLRELYAGFDAAAWQEFAEEAAQAWCDTLTSIERLRIDAKAREDLAALVEAQRVENQRVAAELAEHRRKFDEQVAELARQQASLQQSQNSPRQESGAQTGGNAENMVHPTDDAAPVGDPAEGGAAAPPGTSPQPPDEVQPVVSPAGGKRVITIDLGDTQPIDLPPPVTPPTLRLGAISARLGFMVTADFLSARGFPPAQQAGAAKLYHEHEFQALCAAIAEHVLKIAEQHT